MGQADIALREGDHHTKPAASAEAEQTLAVILAGGEGRRMGGSKPLRTLGKTTLIAHALKLARGYCPTVAVSVRSLDQLAGVADAELLIDPPRLEGPLAGLEAALTFARREGAAKVLTLPCDAPRLPSNLRSRLESVLDRNGLAKVAMASSGGRLHPTCALWSVDALEPLRAYAAAGGRSLKGLAGELCMAIVAWDAEEADPFANANTPEELAALQSGGSEFGY
ncbi:MAG TPA: molybdenum cofactor guanylyltransferase [Phenylobacterium sp.]|nr:molybdenum cofactor guanylyltransferase [Phenylobacterium sp.]